MLGEVPEVMGYSIRTDRYRYTEWRKMQTADIVGCELYDHTVDNDEHHNVAAESPDVSNDLARRLRHVFPDRKWKIDDVVGATIEKPADR